MEENVRICDICGCEIKEEDGTWVDDQFLCHECVDEHCTTCDHCGETIWINDAVQDDDTALCETCYNDYYHRCECCNRIIHDNNINWRGDYPYCNSCYDDFNNEIEEYSYKPDPVFYGDGNRYLGVELEVDCGGKDDDNASKLKEIANASHEHIYIKSDGSIDDGFEIVSHPMTLDYHKNNMDWESVLHEAIKMGYRSHQTSTCGLHKGITVPEASVSVPRIYCCAPVSIAVIYACDTVYMGDLLLEQTAKELGVPFKAIHIETKEAAQNAPTPITTYALFYNGEYLTNEQMNDKKFIKLISK